jgi:hypothetical protein
MQTRKASPPAEQAKELERRVKALEDRLAAGPGAQGRPGEKGARGEKGDTGESGNRGAEGPRGPGFWGGE